MMRAPKNRIDMKRDCGFGWMNERNENRVYFCDCSFFDVNNLFPVEISRQLVIFIWKRQHSWTANACNVIQLDEQTKSFTVDFMMRFVFFPFRYTHTISLYSASNGKVKELGKNRTKNERKEKLKIIYSTAH